MLEFTLYLVVMVALVMMTLITVRAVPRISEEEIVGGQTLEQWLRDLPLQKIDQTIRRYTNKTLRRLRVWILKIDNAVSGYLDKTKEENGENGRELLDLEGLQKGKKKTSREKK